MFYKENKASYDSIVSTLKIYYASYKVQFNNLLKNKVPYSQKLLYYQKDTIMLGVYRRHNVYALDPGLGKSIAAATVSEAMSIKKTLIICPAICTYNWFEELTIVWGIPLDDVTLYDSKRDQKSPSERYVIASYGILKTKERLIIAQKYGHIIIDEAHNIKNTKSARYKMVSDLCNKHSSKAKVSLLTGTPMKNRVDDLFSYLKVTGHHLGKSKSDFENRFALKNNGIGAIIGIKNPELLKDLMSNFIIRYRKEDCLNLPEKVYHKYMFEIGDYKDAYNEALKAISATYAGKNVDMHIMTLCKVTSLSKVTHIIGLVQSIIETGEKVVIFSYFKETINRLQEAFKNNSVVISGDVSQQDRMTKINKFKTKDNVNVFIGQISASGVGINLTIASNVIICDITSTLTHADISQGIDRIDRIGQDKSPNIYYALCKSSIDIEMFNLIETKAHDAEVVIDGKPSLVDYNQIKASALQTELDKIKDYGEEETESIKLFEAEVSSGIEEG